jgi:hypothetical protein
MQYECEDGSMMIVRIVMILMNDDDEDGDAME